MRKFFDWIIVLATIFVFLIMLPLILTFALILWSWRMAEMLVEEDIANVLDGVLKRLDK